nr:hypothetical protein [Tanacetum cinerariifolium]
INLTADGDIRKFSDIEAWWHFAPASEY